MTPTWGVRKVLLHGHYLVRSRQRVGGVVTAAESLARGTAKRAGSPK